MLKAGGGGLVFVGILIILVGFILMLPIVDWLITGIAWLFIIVGSAVGISGIVKMFSGDRT